MPTKSKNRRQSKAAKQPRSKKPKTPIPVRAVDFVMYCTKDMRGTRSFYQELFGLSPGEEWNDFWSEFDTEPVALCLNGARDKPGRRNWQGPAAVALAVHNIQAAIRECRRRKVKILVKPIESNVCWLAIIADPAGNRVCLHQRKNGTAG
jgi:predicted enzyme related to lactoylglutathione lyase